MQEIYFNKNINFLVKYSNINQAELAKIIGVTRQAIYNILNKNSDVRISTVMKIAAAYNVSPSDLLFVDMEQKLKDKKLIIV